MKPQPKKEVAIVWQNEDVRHISFYASADALEDFKEFGSIFQALINKERYSLIVDARYDFNEVLAYIENWEDR
jgi:hypothetical protein